MDFGFGIRHAAEQTCRGRNGESSVIPSHIREGFRGVRSSLKGVADVVETAFAEAGRELEAFSHRILSSAQVKRMQEDGKLRSLNVIEGASKSRFLSSQLAPTNAQASIKVAHAGFRQIPDDGLPQHQDAQGPKSTRIQIGIPD